jgi:hypothetical protein
MSRPPSPPPPVVLRAKPDRRNVGARAALAAQVRAAFAQSAQGTTLTALAEKMGLPESVCRRILSPLPWGRETSSHGTHPRMAVVHATSKRTGRRIAS